MHYVGPIVKFNLLLAVSLQVKHKFYPAPEQEVLQ